MSKSINAQFVSRLGSFVLIVLIFWPVGINAQWSGSVAPTTGMQSISDSKVPAGTLTVIGDQTKQFPLKHTDVQAKLTGFIANVEIRQVYVNPFTSPIEAVYVFPLPHNASVYDMEMKVGTRVIRSEIKKREEAQQLYEQAKQRGQRAALLEQERPNIFTQSVANILPGDEITVLIRYSETLVFTDNRYQFVFPMVVGPRYIPGDWLENNFVPRVTDFNRINPPVLPPGTRSGHDISLAVQINTRGIPITELSSVTHQISTTRSSDDQAQIEIADSDTIPNKDFVLEYALGSAKPQFAFFPYRSADSENFFSLMIQPQTKFELSEVTPKELFFIVDTSGSMSGEPIEKSKEAMIYALSHLNPEDSFYLMKFSNETLRLSDRPSPNTPDNILKGIQYIKDIEAGGGTEMLPGILEALEYPHDPGKLRIVVMMGDGYIGNENEILGAIQSKLGDQSRLFSFGIGSSVNRYLLDSMGRIGRGGAYYVTLRDDSAKIIDEFYRRIASPLFTDISIDWGTLDIDELYPELVPDIFAGHPMYIYGRLRNPAPTTIKVSGRFARVEEGSGSVLRKLFGGSANIDRHDEEYTIPVSFSATDNTNSWIARHWATAKITRLSDELLHRSDPYGYGYGARREDPTIVAQITELGLKYRLSTKYTSFVAIDQTPVTTPGSTSTVPVPVELPEGTTYEGFFGPTPTSGSGSTSPGTRPFTIEPIGAAVGLGTADLKSSIVNLLTYFIPLLLLVPPFLIGSITTAVYRRRHRDDPNAKRPRRIFWRTFGWTMLILVVGLIVLAWFIDQEGSLRPFISRYLGRYLPLVVIPILLIRAFMKRTTWLKVSLYSLAVLTIIALMRVIGSVQALSSAPEVFTRAATIYKLIMIVPLVAVIVYAVAWTGIIRRQRWGVWVGIVLATFGVIVLLVSGILRPIFWGWQLASVSLLVSLLVLQLRSGEQTQRTPSQGSAA